MTLRASLTAVAVALAAGAPAAAQQPNLLFVLTDDQRTDALEVMPKTAAAFPVDFAEFVVSTPNCCPSRATFLTGRHIHSTGVHVTSRAGYEAFRSSEQESLGPWLQRLGYRTGFVGKYFNQYMRTDPVPPGWDEFYGRLYGDDRGNGSTEFTLREYQAVDGGRATDTVVAYPNEEHPEAYATRVFGEKAEAFVRRAVVEDRPFALLLWTIGVNTGLPEPIYADAELPPWTLPPSFLEAQMGDKPRAVRTSAKRSLDPAVHEAQRATQLRQALTIDDEVGDLIALLDELGIGDETVGVFTSDNGRLWGEHGLTGKVWAYEESARVPFRMMLPGAAPATITSAAGNVDLAPTLLELAGATPAAGFHGRSLLPLIADPAAPWRQHMLLESYKPGFCGYRGARWKYVQHASGEEELYDLARDPYELQSLHRQRLAVILRYRAMVRRSECRPFRPLGRCTKTGTAGADRIRGTRWPDRICAGRGRDIIRARGGSRDVVKCGRGMDTVYADRRDGLRGCERVRR